MKKYSLVVVGGGTAGCAAAYISAKYGLKTLLIEKNSYLGGSMTGGLVTPAMKSADLQINTEFFNEFIKKLNSKNAQITYFDGNIGWFNPEIAKIVLDELLINVGVDISLNTNIVRVDKYDKTIKSLFISAYEKIAVEDLSVPIETSDSNYKKGTLSTPIETILYSTNNLTTEIEADYIIDSTAAQVLCRNLGCRFIDDNDKKQPNSLRFIASGVDLDKFLPFILKLDKDRNATTGGYINGTVQLSTACTWDKTWALTPLFKAAVEEGVLKEEDTSYFQIFTIPGMPSSIAFNCPRFSKTAKEEDLLFSSSLIIKSRESIQRLILFCRKYFPGFENSYISSIAPNIGIRTSIRPLGRYVYTINDLKNGRTFDNPVLRSNYPIDIHSEKKEEAQLEKVMKEYQLPIEALQSADYNNLFFAGRSISCDFYSQAALRIIPSCFSMGEGLAKYLAKLSNS